LPGIIDTHNHLNEITDLEQALSDARKEGIRKIIAVGVDDNSNRQTMDISKKYPGMVYPALGLHPWSLDNLSDRQLDDTLKYIEDNTDNITAIGEIGLDYNKRVLAVASKDRQKEVFKMLLSLAARYDKPVSVHSRYAWKDCFKLVSEANIKKADFHWFTGFSSTLEDILSAGYYISVTPAAEYHEEHRRAVKHAPLEQLLLETDCPVAYGRDSSRYDSRPADLVRSLKAAAGLKDIAVETIAEYTTNNATRLFNLK
jgi:TatD DNase family protein